MKQAIARVVAAVLLVVTAWLCWREAGILDRAADSRMQLALLRFNAADAPAPTWTLSDALSNEPRSLAADARRDASTAEYWRGAYTDAMDIGRQQIDPDVLLIAANASFRTAQREGAAGGEAVQRLDGVLQAYAAVLKAAPEKQDAAYNYELVSRLRDATARASQTRGKVAVAPPTAAPTPVGDLPHGPTIHGVPGAPPPDVKAEDFKIIAPMDFGDREAQPEPTSGGKLRRKG
jgi:hypothetical protein